MNVFSNLLEKLEDQLRGIKIFSILFNKLEAKINSFLTKEYTPPDVPLNNFSALVEKAKLSDVILVEGCSRVSAIIRQITQSQWSHSALYIGAANDIADTKIKQIMLDNGTDLDEKYVLESLMGEGMVLTPMNKYAKYNIRICRAKGLTKTDAKLVAIHTLRQLGREYDVRQLLDLARFMFPFYGILPRRWRSSLFTHNVGKPTKAVCSTAVAEAFMSVHFPILPVITVAKDGSVMLKKRNPKLFVPRDFDYSSYFEIIKHPFVQLPTSRFDFAKTKGAYHNLPWDNAEGMVCNDDGTTCYRITPENENKEEMKT